MALPDKFDKKIKKDKSRQFNATFLRPMGGHAMGKCFSIHLFYQMELRSASIRLPKAKHFIGIENFIFNKSCFKLIIHFGRL